MVVLQFDDDHATRERVVQRKVLGGKDRQEAIDYFNRVDLETIQNIRASAVVAENTRMVDVVLTLGLGTEGVPPRILRATSPKCNF